MDYKLAKELKEAGFPQRQHVNGRVATECGEIVKAGNFAYATTLEELIEACGKVRFVSLESCIPNELCSWRATGLNNEPNEIATTGDTPVEAVARLWLALNKK